MQSSQGSRNEQTTAPNIGREFESSRGIVSANGGQQMGNQQEQPTENTTNEKGELSKSKSMQIVESVTRTEASQVLSMILEEGESGPLALLKDSNQRLFNVMHSQVEKIEQAYLDGDEQHYRKLSMEEVSNIATLMTQIRENVKTQVEVIKVKKDIVKDLVIKGRTA